MRCGMKDRNRPKGEYNTAGEVGNPNLKTTGNGYEFEMKMQADRMSEQAKMRRRLFAAHYIKTTNATSSAIFAGFQSPHIKGTKLLREPYVQDLVQAMLAEVDLDAIMTKREVLFAFKREALDETAANQGARISALAHIAKIHGMVTEKKDVTVSGNPSGVMIVPAVSTPEEWSKQAKESQASLKATVKD